MATQETKQNLELLDDKIEKVRTVITNLQSFKDWSFAAYRVEAREKDIVLEGMSYYKDMLEDIKKILEASGEDKG